MQPMMWLLIGSMIAYITFHELVHAVVFKYYALGKVKLGFHVIYASASVPTDYFYKKEYMYIGLAPLVVFSILFTIPLFFTNNWWFLFFFVLLTIHISGCVGDIYVASKLRRYPSDTLINDQGISMTFYTSINTN